MNQVYVGQPEARTFVFLEYNPQELEATPGYEPTFRMGDLLVEAPHKIRWLGADEIVVMRVEDRIVDSVWPEEVLELDPLFTVAFPGSEEEEIIYLCKDRE